MEENDCNHPNSYPSMAALIEDQYKFKGSFDQQVDDDVTPCVCSLDHNFDQDATCVEKSVQNDQNDKIDNFTKMVKSDNVSPETKSIISPNVSFSPQKRISLKNVTWTNLVAQPMSNK